MAPRIKGGGLLSPLILLFFFILLPTTTAWDPSWGHIYQGLCDSDPSCIFYAPLEPPYLLNGGFESDLSPLDWAFTNPYAEALTVQHERNGDYKTEGNLAYKLHVDNETVGFYDQEFAGAISYNISEPGQIVYDLRVSRPNSCGVKELRVKRNGVEIEMHNDNGINTYTNGTNVSRGDTLAFELFIQRPLTCAIDYEAWIDNVHYNTSRYYDTSFKSLQGLPIGTPIQINNSLFGRALNLTGSEYLSTPANTTAANMSYTFWVLPTTTASNGGGVIFDWRNRAKAKVNFSTNTTTVNLTVSATGTVGYTFTTPFIIGTWTHIGVRYDSTGAGGNGQASLYQDGVFIGSNQNILHALNLSLGPLTIGADTNGNNKYTGGLDELIIFDSDIGASAISRIYNTGWLHLQVRDEVTDQLVTAPLSAQITNSTEALEQIVYTSRYHPGEIITPSTDARRITLSANTTYTFPRHLLLSSALPWPSLELNLTIYLLRDGIGAQNTIIIRDSRFGTIIRGAALLLSYSNHSIDYGQTDTTGTFSTYLDPLRSYNLTVTATGYLNKTFNLFGLSSQILYLDIVAFNANLTPSLVYTPSGSGLSSVSPLYLFVTITNWKNLDNLTVAVATSPQYLKLWETTGASLAGSLDVFTFNFSNVTGWCDLSTLCTGDNTTIRFRVMQSYITAYGGTAAVESLGHTPTGTKYAWSKMDFFTTHKGAASLQDLVNTFTQEQRYFTGFIFLLLFTATLGYRLRLTKEQLGYIVGVLIIPLVYIGLFDKALVVIPLLSLVYLLVNRESKA